MLYWRPFLLQSTSGWFLRLLWYDVLNPASTYSQRSQRTVPLNERERRLEIPPIHGPHTNRSDTSDLCNENAFLDIRKPSDGWDAEALKGYTRSLFVVSSLSPRIPVCWTPDITFRADITAFCGLFANRSRNFLFFRLLFTLHTLGMYSVISGRINDVTNAAITASPGCLCCAKASMGWSPAHGLSKRCSPSTSSAAWCFNG